MNLTPGQQLDRYVIGRYLGSGAMGVVYEATDTRLGRTVALKLVHEELARSEEFRNRLTEEAQRAALIDSPYVVRVWELGEVDGTTFVSLEYVAGQTLREAADDLSFQNRLDVAQQLASGIQAAHAAGVIHRDLKPENIKLTASGDVRILDFGLALVNRREAVDASGDIEGTVAYCSPEQLSAGDITPASDLFNLGVVLFELFTGRRPFEGEYSAAVIYSILYEDPPGPQELYQGVPYWLNDLILALLNKAPSARPGSAAEVERLIAENRLTQPAPDVPVKAQRRQRMVTVENMENLSGDPGWNYLCDAVSTHLIGSLTQRTSLVVSAEPSKARPKDLTERFERYHCDYLISGMLERRLRALRLTLSIFEQDKEEPVSRTVFNSTPDQLFVMLASASEDTAETLAALSGTAPQVFADQVAPDVTAYDYYLKGRSYYTSRQEDLKRAEELFRKALKVDSHFAPAHAGLADVYLVEYMAYYDRRPEKMTAARDAAQRALEIDPALPEAHRALGRYYMFAGERERAEKSLLRAVRHNSKYAIGYRTLAWLKSMEGELDSALGWASQALKLAPTDLESLLLVGLIHMDRREFTPAMATLRRAIELGPDYGRAYYNLGTIYMRLGAPEPALENFVKAIRFQGDPNAYADAGYACLVLRDIDSARQHFLAGIAAGHMPFICQYYIGAMEMLEGKPEAAAVTFAEALRSLEEHDPKGEDPHLAAWRAAVMAYTAPTEARHLLASICEREDLTGEDLYCISRAYATLGDSKPMQRFLQRAISAHDGPSEKEAALDPLRQALS